MKSKSTFIGLIFLAAAGLAAYVVHLSFTSIFASFNIANTPILGDNFLLSTLIGVVVGGALGAAGFMMGKSKAFVGDVLDEMSKIHWPEWAETKVNTLVVIVFSFVAAGILGVFDAVFSWLTNNNLFLY